MSEINKEENMEKNRQMDEKKILKHIPKLVVLLIVLIFLFSSVYIIKAGQRGVILTFGKADLDAKEEGLHFKIPIVQKIIKMDIKTQKYEADLTAASRDLQDVNTKIAINYHLIPDSVPRLYSEIGMDYSNRVIQPLEQETNKAITAQFTAEELITKRDSVRGKMKATLEQKLFPRGIIVEDISIVDFKFSGSFTQAIEAKVTAEQLKLKADRDLERIRVEAEQRITQAKAEAEALRLQKQEVTPELIRLRQIEVQMKALEKWNGVLPFVVSGTTPFIDVTSFAKGG